MLARAGVLVQPSAQLLPCLAIACAPSTSSSTSFNPLGEYWKFTRPHTMYGTAVSVAALSAWAAPTRSLGVTTALTAAVPALLANVYIVGLNQLSDIEIDKINKPQLPLASGRLSVARGRQIVLVSLLGSLALTAGARSLPLAIAVGGSILLGTVYSLPPIRLKRWPLAAAFCSACRTPAIPHTASHFALTNSACNPCRLSVEDLRSQLLASEASSSTGGSPLMLAPPPLSPRGP